MGEIAHSILKMSQGIRGTREQHISAIQDGIADLLIYTLDFCARNGYDADTLLSEVWERVKHRDWKHDPQTGGNIS